MDIIKLLDEGFAWTKGSRLSLSDAVVPGWDIGRTTGENADIPAGLAEPLLGDRQGTGADGLRGTPFAEAVPIEGGSTLDGLVVFLGCTP